MTIDLTLYLVRHGETEWSLSGRHTGITDVELTEHGVAQARQLRSVLADVTPTRVLSSPRRRATETARLAGFGDLVEIDERLAEWTYGLAEGRTTTEIRQDVPGWSVWDQPLAGAESADEVGQRVDGMIEDLRSSRNGDGIILLFGHSHLSRIFAARWCGWSAHAGANLVLDPASFSVVGYDREYPAILQWNRAAEPARPRAVE